MYFKRQCKFERFVSNMAKTGKGPGALAGLIGGSIAAPPPKPDDQEDEESDMYSDNEDETKPAKEIVGFDTRF